MAETFSMDQKAIAQSQRVTMLGHKKKIQPTLRSGTGNLKKCEMAGIHLKALSSNKIKYINHKAYFKRVLGKVMPGLCPTQMSSP